MQTYTIKPGWLVGLKTRLVGGVSYKTEDEGRERDGRREESRWKTTKRVADKVELDAATDTRNRAAALVRGACIATPFGLLCPDDLSEFLEGRISDAERLVREHNSGAVYTKVEIFTIKGRIASDDKAAVKAIFSDVRQSIDDMKAGIKSLDVGAIRAAAQKARNLGAMLDRREADRVGLAVKAARKIARELVRRIDQNEALADWRLSDISTRPIDDLRFSFLDTSDPENGDSDAGSFSAAAAPELEFAEVS